MQSCPTAGQAPSIPLPGKSSPGQGHCVPWAPQWGHWALAEWVGECVGHSLLLSPHHPTVPSSCATSGFFPCAGPTLLMDPAEAPLGAASPSRGTSTKHCHPGPAATAGQLLALFNGQHLMNPRPRSPPALSQAPFRGGAGLEAVRPAVSCSCSVLMCSTATAAPRHAASMGRTQLPGCPVPQHAAASCTPWKPLAARGSWRLRALGLPPQRSSGVLLIPHRHPASGRDKSSPFPKGG